MSAIVSFVLARADNGVIGANNAIPWRIPEDMKRFKAITMGKPIVMGRKTWDSFPRKPLPGRTNIVITRDATWKADGAVVAHSLEEGLKRAESETPDEIAVIGGAEIFQMFEEIADAVELTEVRLAPEGDAVMPPFDPARWREVSREDFDTHSFVRLERA